MAADNLEWAKKLEGGQVPFDCLLSYDTATEQSSVDHVEKLARQYFRRVELFRYDAPHETTWPEAPNVAWQSVALHIGQFVASHWFWWEADATPLIKGWLRILDAAYLAGQRPFAGHVLSEMGHMNGVAVYPPLVAKFCPKALYCRAAPWDVMLREETIVLTTPLNELIYHYPRFNGVKCQVKDAEVPKKMVESGFVIFHGCNDGSILKVLQGEKPFDYGDHPSVKIFGVEDIGRKVDESEALWFKEAIRLHKTGRSIVPYEECRMVRPTIVEQAKANGWTAGIFDLPVAEGLGHLNSGLCKDDRGQYWLVTRRWERREHMERSWHSTLWAFRCWWETSGVAMLGEPVELKVSEDPFMEAEDPRVVFHGGKFYVSYCAWSQRSIYHARQIFAEFDRDWNFKNSLKVPYGFNDIKTADKHTKVAEKNWTFFRHNEAWHFCYAAEPHVVVEVGKKRTIEHKAPSQTLNWQWGDIRGGTPPVLVNGEYFTFFHSSLPWKRRQKRYVTGAYAFEAKHPFKVTRITPEPLLFGSEKDSHLNRAPLTAFTCGAVHDDGEWILSGGVNDERSFWCRLPHADLLSRMVSV